MPIEQKRVEAACRAIYGKTWDGPLDKMPGPEMKDVWRKHISKILAGGFPELASDPPTGWVAPWEATDAMQSAAANDETPFVGGSAEEMFQSLAAIIWKAARDAHIKEQGDE